MQATASGTANNTSGTDTLEVTFDPAGASPQVLVTVSPGNSSGFTSPVLTNFNDEVRVTEARGTVSVPVAGSMTADADRGFSISARVGGASSVKIATAPAGGTASYSTTLTQRGDYIRVDHT
jgi:Asp/Glu/hydantoin racemase